MVTNKHIDRICIAAVILALLITVLFMNGRTLGIEVKATTKAYENRLFDNTKVHTIDILIDDRDAFLATAQSEEYSMCDVIIDGEPFQNVGIRGKGNTSLSTVSTMGSDRYSFKLEFDQYDSTKSYHGLDKLSLNNLIQDNTMMKDYLTYQMMTRFGVAAPLCSFVYITFNGEDWGLYLAVEAVEESFLQRNYGNDYGELYKPDSNNMGGGRGNGKDFQMEDFDPSAQNAPGGMMPAGDVQAMMPGQNDRPEAAGQGTDDVKLLYTGDALENYANIFVSCKTDATTADQQRLVKSIRALNEQQQLQQVLDIEAVLRYFVVHNYVVNADSYTGTMIHNYYLYEEDGRLSMIPWDYNLAFGTFQSNDAAAMVCDDINVPLSVTGTGRPMIDWIYASEDYTAQYHALFREFLDTVDVQSIISQAKDLIAPYVERDPTKFCTYDQFDQGVQTLSTFCSLRSESVHAQLLGQDGTVDTSDLDLSRMGTMGHGMTGGDKPTKPDSTEQMTGRPGAFTDTAENGSPTDGMQQMPNFQGGMMPPGGMELPEGMSSMFPGQTGSQMSGAPTQIQPGAPTGGPGTWIWIGISALIMLAGLIFAYKFKR